MCNKIIVTMNKLCKFYINGHCKKGRNCDFEHVTGPNTLHKQPKYRSKKRTKNTENFEPCHDATDMRIVVASGKQEFYPNTYLSRDVILIMDMFGEKEDWSIYHNLLQEIKNSNISETHIWKSWHGDSHLIADDKKNWKAQCPTFNKIIKKIATFFKMDIKATRLNWYRNSSEWKPFHHDAAAVKPDKAKSQNITVGISFGEEREAAFQHASSYTTISVPLPNNSIYIFNRDTNIIWRHGILQQPPSKYSEAGRISIIAWGWVEMEDCN